MIMAKKRARRSIGAASGWRINTERVLREMQVKRAKFQAISRMMRKNKRISREAMQHLIRI
jgi:hypothetical protein